MTPTSPRESQPGYLTNQKLCGVDLKVVMIATAIVLSIVGGGIAYAYSPVAGIAIFSTGGAGTIASLVAYAVTHSKKTLAEPPPTWEIRDPETGDPSGTHFHKKTPLDLRHLIDECYASKTGSTAHKAAVVSSWVRELCFSFCDAKEKAPENLTTYIHLEVPEEGEDSFYCDPVLLVAAQLKAAYAAKVTLIFHPVGDSKTVIGRPHEMSHIIDKAKTLADSLTETQMQWCPRVVEKRSQALETSNPNPHTFLNLS